MRWIADAGHEWLEVDAREYPDAESFGTGYGYVDPGKGLVYLEGDIEAALFAHAHGLDASRFGEEFVVGGDAWVRSLPRIRRSIEDGFERMLAIHRGVTA